MMSIMSAEIYLILSGKGGVGKTTVFSNLATSIAMSGKEIIVIDADLAMPNLGLVFGMINAPITIHDVLAGSEPIEKAIYEGPHGLKFIPGGESIEGYQAADPSRMIDVLDNLKEKADYILIDAPVGLNEDVVLLLPEVDHVIIISTPDLISTADALRMRLIAESTDMVIDGAILNRTNVHDENGAIESFGKTMELKILAVIPDDINVHKAALDKIPLVISNPDSPASIAIRKLAAQLTGVEFIPDTRKSGIFQKILGTLGFNVNSNEGQN
ncbi:MAG: P-loop NTPase [ANME-2 cluster archaeon]|jgi:septum site-determining protein MinD|nr:P-loop NTPase [ANME-2 cluster archaeon]